MTNNNTMCMKLVNWIMCCKEDNESTPNLKDLGKNDSNVELPGYLNRFDGTSKSGGAWSGSDEDISANDSIKKFKRRGANSVASDNPHSECDSGLGSASDSGRGKSTKSENDSTIEGSASETEKCPEEVENIKRLQSLVRKSEPITVAPVAESKPVETDYEPKIEESPEQPEVVEEKPKKAYIKSGRRKPKRNESTLSRFSSIFNNGRNLTDVLVDEFRLNDRFSGLSMDRIWGGFMDEIKEDEGEKGTSQLPPASPDTKARQALNDKTKRRRRRRSRMPVVPEEPKQQKAIKPKSFKRQKTRKHWQQELPQDWQDVIAL